MMSMYYSIADTNINVHSQLCSLADTKMNSHRLTVLNINFIYMSASKESWSQGFQKQSLLYALPGLTLKIVFINSINDTLHTDYLNPNKHWNFLFFLWFYSLVPALTTPEQWNYTFKKLTLQGRYSYMSNLKKQRPSWEANSSSESSEIHHII